MGGDWWLCHAGIARASCAHLTYGHGRVLLTLLHVFMGALGRP